MDNTVSKIHVVCPHCNATNRVPSDKSQAELNCGQCHASLLNAHPDNLNEAAFHAQLQKKRIADGGRFLGALVWPLPHDGASL